MFRHMCRRVGRAHILQVVAVAALVLPAARAQGEVQWLSQKRSVILRHDVWSHDPLGHPPEHTVQTLTAPDFSEFRATLPGSGWSVEQTSSFGAFGGGRAFDTGEPHDVWMLLENVGVVAGPAVYMWGSESWTSSAEFEVTFRLTERSTFDGSYRYGPGLEPMQLAASDGTIIYASMPQGGVLDPGVYTMSLSPRNLPDCSGFGLVLDFTAVPEPATATLLFALAAPLLLRRTRSRQ